MSFGKYLKRVRGKRGISREKLAKEAGISLPLLVSIEEEERRTSRAAFLKLSKVMKGKGESFLKMFNSWEG